MRTAWIIARKELASFFDSMIAYILLVVFLGVVGFLSWWNDGSILAGGQANLYVFFVWSYWLLPILVPALAMRTLAEERKTGTLDLLLTKAVTDWQVVFGKFIACMMLVAAALLCTLPYWITIARIGPVDHGSVLSGYLALLLVAAGYSAIGIYASSATNNQIVAFLLGLFLCAVFHLLTLVSAGGSVGLVGEVLQFLSTGSHFDSMSRGVIDSRDLLFFVSLVVLGLSLAEVNLAKRLIRGA